MAAIVIMIKNVLEARKLFFFTTQAPSGPHSVFRLFLNDLYHAKPKAAIAKPSQLPPPEAVA